MSSDGKFFLAVVIGAVVILGGVIFFSQKNNTTPGEQVTIDTTIGQKIGSDTAPVKIVEFGDFQCPACQAAEPALKEILAKNKDSVQFIYRHFPLPSHKNGESSSLAAEAASNQGKFWEMHDLLYARQNDWATLADPTDTFAGYATSLGLDEKKFRDDLKADSAIQKVKTDADYGESIGVNQTPTFYINGTKSPGVKTVEQWQAIIDDAKSASTATQP